MIVENNYSPALVDFNVKGEMELSAILRLFENTGSKHSDMVGDGILNRSMKGTAWVFTDWYVEVKQYPKYGDKIMATTWSEPANAIFTSSRNFELYCNGELAVIATTRWAIMDLTTGRPTKIGKELIDLYEPDEKKTFAESKLPKIPVLENWDIEKQIFQRRTDIDFNNHVHNITYLDYAMETLPQELYDNREFKHLHISYKFPLMIGEATICKYGQNEGKHIFAVYGKDNMLKTQIELY